MKIVWSVCLLCLLTACSQSKLSKLDFLKGTWKIEGKEKYEKWERAENNELAGSSYKIENEQEIVWEKLLIRQMDDKIVYEATVADQNEGKTIQFKLNEDIDSCYSFENENHDFPKKIQYKIITKNKVEVSVLGDDGEGFSYFQIRQ